MARAERLIARAWAEATDAEVDRLLTGAKRRGELDRMLGGAGCDEGAAPIRRWPGLVLAAAAAIVISLATYVLWSTDHPLTAALDTVRVAQRSGEQVPASAANTVRKLIGDGRAADLLLANPLDVAVFDDAASDASTLRGNAVDGLVWISPGGAIADTRPRFLIRTGLPSGQEWRIELQLSRVDADDRHTVYAAQLTDANPADRVVFELDDGLRLAPGRWRGVARLAANHELPWKPAHAEFHVVTATLPTQLRESTPKSGNDRLDRRVYASVLLTHDLAAAALRVLEADRSPTDDAIEHAADLLLRVRANAILGDRDAIDRLRATWQALVTDAKRG